MVIDSGLTDVLKSCSGSSGLRYSSWLTAMLPGSVLMIVAMFADTDSVEWSLNIIGLILMIVIPLIFVPLHKED